MVRLGKDTIDFEIQSDIWKFRQEYYDFNSNKEELIEAGNNIKNKYKGMSNFYDFVCDLIDVNVKDIIKRNNI